MNWSGSALYQEMLAAGPQVMSRDLAVARVTHLRAWITEAEAALRQLGQDDPRWQRGFDLWVSRVREYETLVDQWGEP